MSNPGLLRRSQCVWLVALAGLGGAACAGLTPSTVSPEGVASPALASVTPLVPLDPTEQPTPAARALTGAGCCARHWWSPDSALVLFIDDPPGEATLGLYAVPTAGGEASFVSKALDGESLASGAAPPELAPTLDRLSFRLPADAENVRLSPDGTGVAWTVGSSLPVNIDRRQRSLWVIDAPAGLRRRLTVLTGGDLVGWAEDGEAVLATGRISTDSAAGIWRVPIDGSTPKVLAEAERPRGVRLSPSARWLAYYLAFETEAERNGLWIVGTSGAVARRLPSFGSFRWGTDDRLFFIPFSPQDPALTLAAFDPATGATEAVWETDSFPGGIAANDWSVSPDGKWIVYRTAADASLWIAPIHSE
jgi:hypothetical protein